MSLSFRVDGTLADLFVGYVVKWEAKECAARSAGD
jgi:hypothetical protein